MTLLQRTNRIALPSKSSGNGNGADEQVKVTNADGQTGYLFDKIVQDSSTFPTLIAQLIASAGVQQLQLSSESYFGKVLWLDPDTGNDAEAQRGKINRKFQTLSRAMLFAQSGDTIINIGSTLSIPSNIIISNKNLTFMLLGSTLDYTGGNFFINGSEIKFFGHGKFQGAGASSKICIASNSTVKLDGFFEVNFTGAAPSLVDVNGSSSSFYGNFHGANITTRFGIAANEGIATVKNVGVWTLGAAINSFSVGNGGTIRLVDIDSIANQDFNNQSTLFAVNVDSAIILERCRTITCARMLYKTIVGGSSTFDIIDCKISGSQAPQSVFGFTMIQSFASASIVLNIVRSKLSSNEGTVLNIYGELNINDSYIETADRDENVIEYTQTLANGGQMINSCMIGLFIFNTDNSTAFVPGKFVADGIRTNDGFPLDPQIIEGTILVDELIYLPTTSISQ